MKLLLLLAFTAAVRSSGVTIGAKPHSHPVQSLYHAQDNYGQYVYGYATPTSSKSESKTADGVTQGGYSYIDANGLLQTVQYVADPIHGFRVAATNLPRDLPDVAYAKAKHLADFAQIAAQHTVHYTNPIVVPVGLVPQPVQDLPEVVRARAQHLALLNAAYANAGTAPSPVQDLPEVVKARREHLAIVEETKARNAGIQLSPVHLRGNVVPVHTIQANPIVGAVVGTQYHAQDGLGQYSYGYVEPLSAKTETRTADGVTRGGYSYIDANGIVQTVTYVSDAVNGFRVAATNLPVAPRTHVIAPAAPVVVAKAAVPLYSHQLVY